MTVGIPPPSNCEILSRREFSEFIQRTREAFDIVLIDVASAQFNTDFIAASVCTGGALLVTRKNRTRLVDARALTTRIESVGAKVVGAILNEF